MNRIHSYQHAGYRAGVIGQCATMLARFYCRTFGFNAHYEADTAIAIAGFCSGFDASRDGLWFVRRDDSPDAELLGCMAIDGQLHARGTARLRWFYLGEALRGRGLGQQLLDLAIAHCDSLGYARIELDTHERLRAAVHLYEKNGFVQAGSRPCRQWGVDLMFRHFERRLPQSAAAAMPPAFVARAFAPGPGHRAIRSDAAFDAD